VSACVMVYCWLCLFYLGKLLVVKIFWRYEMNDIVVLVMISVLA